jgi:hypothetical protein
LPNAVPDHVARFRAKALRKLIDSKNEIFRSEFIGRHLAVLTLEDGSAISNNFVRVSLPSGYAVNEWTRVLVTGLEPNGLQAGRPGTPSGVHSWIDTTTPGTQKTRTRG